MFYQLPPVGNPVETSVRSKLSAEGCLRAVAPEYQPVFYQSGTAALAAAIFAAVRQRNVRQPEVILPAYACPDLISAVLYADATPVLVDLEPKRPWMNLAQLQQKLGQQTVAVIAVNLFGIAERIDGLRQLANSVGAVVIEDSAQGFPLAGENGYWRADMTVVSFGRGKPVSLLGGGAVLLRDATWRRHMPDCTIEHASALDKAMYRFKAGLYNRLIHPRLYWLLLALPFLHLGETQFHPLEALQAMDETRYRLLTANIQRYQQLGTAVQQQLEQGIADSDNVIKLASACGVPTGRRLLRYPLLVAADKRADLLSQLNHAGLGASVLYPAVLPEIDGIPRNLAIRQGGVAEIRSQYPNAVDFADSLLTLPTHDGVSKRDIARIIELVNNC